jgi:hypothetical protein
MVRAGPPGGGDEDECFPTATTPVKSSPAGAGALLIGAIVACAGAGLGIGALLGVPALLALAGGFVGVGVGFWIVYSRFKDL